MHRHRNWIAFLFGSAGLGCSQPGLSGLLEPATSVASTTGWNGDPQTGSTTTAGTEDTSPGGASTSDGPEGTESSSSGSNPAEDEDWAILDAWLDGQIAAGTLGGYALLVFDAEDNLLHERVAGTCNETPTCPNGAPQWTTDLVTGVASSTKWVTSTTVLAVLEDAVDLGLSPSLTAALDTPLANVLECAGTVTGSITPRQLLSFTSGLVKEHPCVGKVDGPDAPPGGWTLGACACEVLAASEQAMVGSAAACGGDDACPPGSTFRYADTHHTVAGAMVEAISGLSWHEAFEYYVRDPLGLAMTYGPNGQSPNPNLAGSVQASPSDYASFVRAVFHDGIDGQRRVLSAQAVFEQRASQTGADVLFLNTPQPGFDYGLNNWRWCIEPLFDSTFLADPSQIVPDPGCTGMVSVGHGGKGGYMPWVDVSSNSYGVFASREPSAGGGDQYEAGELSRTAGARTFSQWMASKL